MENLELEKAVLSLINTEPELLLDSTIDESYFSNTTNIKIFKLLKSTHSNNEIIIWKLNESELDYFYEIVSMIIDRSKRDDDIAELKELMEYRKYHTISKSIALACEGKAPMKKIKEKIWEYETEEIKKTTKDETLRTIADIMLGQREFVFYSTWYTALDSLLIWFVPWQLNVIAARPSVGKTLMGINLLINQWRWWRKVAYFSLEMSQQDIYQRIIANLWGFSMYETRKEASQPVIDKLNKALEELQENDNLEVVDWIVELTDIIKEIRYLNRKKWTEIFYIDYVGLIEWVWENRNMEVTKITRALKMLAVKLNVVIVIASQLSRNIEKRGLQEPLLSDLRDSGSIEQDADVVIMMQRDLEEKPRELKLYVRKNRNGSVWDCELDCEARVMKIHNRRYLPEITEINDHLPSDDPF